MRDFLVKLLYVLVPQKAATMDPELEDELILLKHLQQDA